jgi:uncharacterized protein YndB with AHSA1/START domain
MLIRKPVAEVFEAFVNPDITTKFWFTKSSGRLEAGKQVQWEWEMYGVSAPVTVKTIEANKRIVIEWLGYSGLTTVEWIFASQKDGTTFVSIMEASIGSSGSQASINDGLVACTSRDGTIPSECARPSPITQGRVGP